MDIKQTDTEIIFIFPRNEKRYNPYMADDDWKGGITSLSDQILCVPCHKITDTYLWKLAPQVYKRKIVV